MSSLAGGFLEKDVCFEKKSLGVPGTVRNRQSIGRIVRRMVDWNGLN